MHLHNIFIVGAAKAGTTALYYLLNQHPQVCAPVIKEPNYFSNLDPDLDITGPDVGPGDDDTFWAESREEYHALYKIKKLHRFSLDASVSYLYSNRAARNIAEYSTAPKIIITLRNPVERAFSHYKHLVRDYREKKSFEEALHREEDRMQKGWEFSWHLRRMGLYSQQVQRYFNHIGRDNIRIFLFEEIKTDMENVIVKTAHFTGLPDFNYEFEQKKHNVSGIPKSKMVSGLIRKIGGYKAAINKVIPPSITHQLTQKFRSVNTKKEELTLREETRIKLINYFRADIKKTAQLIDRDLNHWLN